MPRGVYDRSKSKTEGPKAAKAVAAKPAAQKTAGKTAHKQVAKTAAAPVARATGRTEHFSTLAQTIATLAAINPALCKTAAAKAEIELIAQIDALSDLRRATFGRSVQEQAAYDAEQAQAKAQREQAKAAQATAQDEVQVAPNNGQVPLPARPIMPVPPAPVSA